MKAARTHFTPHFHRRCSNSGGRAGVSGQSVERRNLDLPLPAVAGQQMRLPARHGAQFLLPLHVLEEGDDALNFGDDGGLQPTGIVILDLESCVQRFSRPVIWLAAFLRFCTSS